MGRQAHVVRLALGRSPFGDPLYDENGDFILGPQVHIHDAAGYQQQFDDRGHPQNRSSRTAARRLRKAQNDVLATVGVVVKKGEERKSKWEKLDDDEKWSLIFEENQKGSFLKGEDRVLGLVMSWYLSSLRNRLMVRRMFLIKALIDRFQTLNPYLTMPVLSVVAREFRLLSPPILIFTGLPSYLFHSLPQLMRYYLTEPSVDGTVDFINPWQEWSSPDAFPAIMWFLATTIGRCIEIPLLVQAALQSLQIVPFTGCTSWRSFIPFSSSSPIFLPSGWTIIPRDNGATFFRALVQTPFALYCIRDYLQIEIGYRLYGLFRQVLTKPDRPDLISARVSDESENIDDTSIAGIGCPWPRDDIEYEKHKRNFGPRTFFGALRLAFRPIYIVLNALSGNRLGTSRGRLSPFEADLLRGRINEQYWDTINDPVRSRCGPEDELLFRRLLVYDVFRRANLNPTEELVDPVAWTNSILGDEARVHRIREPLQQMLASRSAANTRLSSHHADANVTNQQDATVSNVLTEAIRMMPVSDAIVIQTSDGPVVMERLETYESGNEMRSVHNIDAADVTRATLMQGVRELQDEVDQTRQPSAESNQQNNAQAIDGQRTNQDARPHTSPTPTPGLTRAVSITDQQVQNPSQPTLRPLRRPTETDDSLAAISQTLRAEVQAHHSRPPSRSQSPISERPRRFNGEIRRPHRYTHIPAIKRRYYRTTMLSNFPADSLAWHASALLTSLILWPIEAMWLRSVANWALQNPVMREYIDPLWAARMGFGVVGRPLSVFSVGTWFGGATDSRGRAQYVGGILLTLGLEGIVRGSCWAFGVWSVRRWKDKYGWGHF